MPLSPIIFQEQFQVFRARVIRKSGVPFTSFREGIAAQWEGYKGPLRQHACKILGADRWRSDEVGTGEILKRTIASIEITAVGEIETNNMVAWQNRYGHASRSHRALLDAYDVPDATRTIEALLFDFYLDRLAPELSFDRIRDFTGARYDLLAYLFFLKDDTRFMPILTSTFDAAFEALGIELVTKQRCSWENYARYNEALQEIRAALQDVLPGQDIRLVDAHSFCWLLIRKELEEPDTRTQKPTKSSRDVKVYDALNKSVWEMANASESAVRQSGQQSVVTKKVKELWMGKSELEAYIKLLIERQEGRCALTNIPLQFRGEHESIHLLASLDRIDSNGHYAEGNLQVVCRFVNGWKSDLSNEEFLGLLALVRGEAE
ncbi:hypothetical protein [Microvirga aerophila]|uniref:Uncharacterized protein n=1 Tax=Microvirga aerophila TaxID=670291 RepID=A0A512C4X6_9HYPH|nr:hypothetical protein [Microvirga aerophila]GEO19259.1 hypothetical protein MAE02_69550 [Microvirga aerophila]